jgi:TatA/E family protein of Tat protein translocase
MPNIGFQEILVILIIALLVFGPRKLPEIGRSIGRAMGEFKRATNDLKSSIEEEVRAEERKTADVAPILPSPGPMPTVPTAPSEPTVSRDTDVIG